MNQTVAIQHTSLTQKQIANSGSIAMSNGTPASESRTSELKHDTTHNHQRLNSFSSATSTEETFFSDDDSDDSDSEYHDEDQQYQMSRQTDEEDESHLSSDDDEEEAPQFETLVVDDDDPARAMSFSVNEEMVEVVPTDMVESLVSFQKTLL
jgi:hypothetical protein